MAVEEVKGLPQFAFLLLFLLPESKGDKLTELKAEIVVHI